MKTDFPPLDASTRSLHVWSIRTEVPVTACASYEQLLSQEERARSATYRFPQHARAFKVVRGTLRILLAGYLNVSPSSLRFKRSPEGKPSLVMSSGLEFNVSHSGGLALLAFTYGCPVGIDVEQIRGMPEMQAIADHFFCAEEASDLAALPDCQRKLAFFLCWTRKEAYVKASGEGICARLDQFRVSLDPVRPARFLRLPPLSTTPWSLTGLCLDPAYASALAYPDDARVLTVFNILEASELLP